jgi:hypothetical protein
MRIGFDTGYYENYWGDWFKNKQLGGSERIVVEVAAALAREHEVTVRLPYRTDPFRYRDVDWIGRDHPLLHFQLSFLFDQFGERDRSERTALVACRSDKPAHKDFDQRIYLSRHHAALMGDAGAPAVGGGVNLEDYARPLPRIPRRVLCTSSPDRCGAAAAIGRAFDFLHTYKRVPGFNTVELPREGLVEAQLTAQVLIYPLDPIRPSDFFSMAVLEALAAGTPVVVSDADSMSELWSQAAIVLPRPIDLGQWYQQVEELLSDPVLWRKHSRLGKQLAQHYSWDKVAARYLSCATSKASATSL